MKKAAGFWPVMLAGALFLYGCGGVSMDADTDTLYVASNGKLTEINVEDFTEDYYDAQELQSEIEAAVEAYRSGSGKKDVVLKECEVENGTAKLLMEYDSYESYAAFIGAEIYAGTVLKAQAEGYEFDVPFYAAGNTETGVSRDEVLADDGSRVLILMQDTDVEVKGEILYVSDHVRVTGENTATVYGEGADSADAGLAYIIYK